MGFQLDYDPQLNSLRLHQTAYAQEIIKTFLPPTERYPRKIPLNPFGNFQQVYEGSAPLEPTVPYKSILGSLYYLANISRPDLLFAVNYLSRSQASPTRFHGKLLLLLLRYVYDTISLGVFFGNSEDDLKAYIDADHRSDVSTKLSPPATQPWSENHEQELYQ